MMELKDCILTRRSVRKFTDQPVEQPLLEEIISLAAYAPSWKNTQISRYIAIQDPEVRNTICTEYAPFNKHIIDSCPTLLVQTFVRARSGFDRDGSYSTDRGEGWQYYDCGVAAQTLCLAAHNAGLGTVIMGVFDRLGLQKYLQLPEEQEVMALIAIGHPAETPAAPKRKDVQTLLTCR